MEVCIYNVGLGSVTDSEVLPAPAGVTTFGFDDEGFKRSIRQLHQSWNCMVTALVLAEVKWS